MLSHTTSIVSGYLGNYHKVINEGLVVTDFYRMKNRLKDLFIDTFCSLELNCRYRSVT